MNQNQKPEQIELKKIGNFISSNKLLIFGIIIGLIGIGLSSYIIYFNENNYIHKNECNKPSGEFAVQTNVSTNATVKLCGSGGNEPCNLPVRNLNQAINECNKRAKFCNKFIYPVNGNNKSMKIVELSGTLNYSEDSHMYIRQNGITFRENKNYDTVTSNTPVSTSSSTVSTSSSTVSTSSSTVSTSPNY